MFPGRSTDWSGALDEVRDAPEAIGVGRCGVADPVPVAHTIMSALHGLTDLLRKGRTIPQKAAGIDEQIDAMLRMVLAYARAAGRSHVDPSS